jgi:O-antigen ligase
MTATTTATTKTVLPRKALPVRIPFLTTSFSTDLYLYTLLWPVWWLIGVEQLLLPFFIAWEWLRYLWQSRLRFRLNSAIVWVALLAAWWIVPVIWVEPDHLDIFLKETATSWSQLLFLFVFWNAIRTRKDWNRALRALDVLAFYLAIGGLVFLAGIWRGDLLSVVGRLLPGGLAESSSFFDSISFRSFGAVIVESAVLARRVSSIALSYSSLSMLCLLLIPIVAWRFMTTRGVARWTNGFVVAALTLCLIFTGSRIAYLAFAAEIGLFLVLRLDMLRWRNKLLSAAFACLLAATIIGVVYLAFSFISDAIGAVFIELRPGSWLVRFSIYRETLRLLWEHPIAGWGAPVQIDNMATVYSAGTHSSYLGMLFQHGIVGLLLYLALWLSLWWVVIRELRQPAQGISVRIFWIAAAAAFFAFNIREVADSWWWDQLLTFTLWLIWGLVLTAPVVFRQGDNKRQLATGSSRQAESGLEIRD